MPRSVIEECLALALQAPNGSNANSWRWIAVDDRATIHELARLYNQGLDDFIATFGARGYDLGAAVPGFDRIGASTQREVAELLGIPHEKFMQAGLFPVAYTLGTDFQPAWRKPVSEVLRWI